MKMRCRRKDGKKIKLLVLLTASIFAASFLAVFAVIYNYISKINFVDEKEHWPKVNTVEDNYNNYKSHINNDSHTNALNDDNRRSGAASDKMNGLQEAEGQDKARKIYERGRDIEDRLNIHGLEEDNSQGGTKKDLPAMKQNGDQIQDMQMLQNNSGASIKAANTDELSEDDGSKAAGPHYGEQGKADGTSAEYSFNGLDEDEPDIEPIIDEKVINILLIGQDFTDKNDTGEESFALFTVNKRSKKLVTTSFYSNMYLYIPGVGKERLRTAYKLGGTRLLQDTLEKNFGIVIDGFIMADYSAYIDIVDLIGGVELDIAACELAPLNRNIREINAQLGFSEDTDLIYNEGRNVLNGKQALGYSRNWYDDYGKLISHGNQKAVVLSILNKVKDFNVIRMNAFLNEVLPEITTNLSESKIVEFIIMLPIYINYALDYLTLPVKGTEKKLSLNGMTVLDFNSRQNISQLRSRLYALQ